MTTGTENRLVEILSSALMRIDSKKESDLCRYLPGVEGHLHHFTYKKLKEQDPEKWIALIEEFVVNAIELKKLPPNNRAPRGSNKANPHFKLPSDMMAKVIQIAREANDFELLKKLIGSRPLAQIKKDLIRSIHDNKADENLWEAYKFRFFAKNS